MARGAYYCGLVAAQLMNSSSARKFDVSRIGTNEKPSEYIEMIQDQVILVGNVVVEIHYFFIRLFTSFLMSFNALILSSSSCFKSAFDSDCSSLNI